MPQVAGVKTKKNLKGEVTHVTFDISKHKETITPILNQLGVIPKTDFQKRCDNAVSVEEARKISINHLREIWKK